jgi:hypothetical protein
MSFFSRSVRSTLLLSDAYCCRGLDDTARSLFSFVKAILERIWFVFVNKTKMISQKKMVVALREVLTINKKKHFEKTSSVNIAEKTHYQPATILLSTLDHLGLKPGSLKCLMPRLSNLSLSP